MFARRWVAREGAIIAAIDWGKIGRESLANKRSKVELWIDKVAYTIRQAKVEIAVLEENPVSQAGEWLPISSM